MGILKHIAAIALAICATGCYEDFYPKIDTEPVLCINSLITAGEPIEVELSHSWVYNDNKGFHYVDDAVVTIYANDQPTDDDYLPAQGDVIRIVAESKKYGAAEASVTVPAAIPIEEINILPETIGIWRGAPQCMTGDLDFNLYASISITDAPDTDNYFKLDFSAVSPDGLDDESSDFRYPHRPYVSFRPGEVQYEAEPIFSEHIGIFESVFGDSENTFMFFSDRQFAGRNYKLQLNFRNGYYSVSAPKYDETLYDCAIEFELSTISRSYYDRLLYIWHRDSGALGDMGDLGFAEPIWAYSNVSTGAGVVAARSVSTCTVSLRDFFEETFNSTNP